jgi:hypothetical protein
MAVGKSAPLNPKAVLNRSPVEIAIPKVEPGSSASRRRAKVGRRSNAEYTQFNVFMPIELKREFEILCIRLGIDNSEGAERLVRAAIEGKINLDT